ncbi:MAG: YbhB/YbcL family Raf kinase inhibitor-like protein [Chlamydiae bacterium]|nr:YbhB/YbcL family Raf kinase inhibitor-like protein [Chlamydiota bacterium]
MRIISSAFKEGGYIPVIYTCDGYNWNPPLDIFDIPKGAKSLLLIVEDPDVPESIRPDKLWIHWIVYDIPPHVTKIKEHTPSPGVNGKGTHGRTAYMGPYPPEGEDHRYFFKIYALDTFFDFPKGLVKEEVEEKIKGHVLGSAELMGRYRRTPRKM